MKGGWVAVVGIAAAAALVGAAVATAGKAKSPKIVVKPASAMVNGSVLVHGKGFAPNTTFTIAECGKTSWSLPANPCSSGNAVQVTTNARGAFKTKLVAKLCPQDSPPTLTQETCYVGRQVVTGIDTLALDPSAALSVSWP